MAHRVGRDRIGERTVLRLIDDETGASAAIVPSLGFNLFDLRLPAGGEVRSMIFAGDDFPARALKPSRHGTPVLFPFPNRVRDARYRFDGKDYELNANSAPNAIHGFAFTADWDVVAHEAGPDSAWVTGRFQISKHAPTMLSNWPADGILEMTYRLAGRRLTLDIVVINPTDRDLPFGFGIHPYFRPPGDPAQSVVVLPAAGYWPLEDNLPVGETRPVDDRLDLRQGRPLVGLTLDDVLTGLPAGGVCRMIDRASGAEFRLGFDDEFRELVVFTPPWVEGVVAIEPYTQTTDAINLQAKGIDAGLRVLGPGREARMALTMETVDI